jgi:deazaflavin-dependent oxidoreductase (nitroreductase family)
MAQPSKVNRFMAFMLRSPLQVFMSGLTLITVTGRKTGQLITTPVNYVRDGDTVLIISKNDRTWWRNLRGGAKVLLRLKGKTYQADATVIEDRSAVEKELLRFFRLAKRTIAGVHLTPEGQPTKPERFAQVVQSRVVVQISGLKRN